MAQGIRPPDIVYELNLADMESMLLQRMPWAEIVRTFIGTGVAGTESTLKAWRQEIRRRWQEADAEERPHRRDEHREQLRDLYHRALKAADFSVCERVLKQLMILDGLSAPEKITIESLPARAMTKEERQREIDALLTKRERAHPTPKGPPS